MCKDFSRKNKRLVVRSGQGKSIAHNWGAQGHEAILQEFKDASKRGDPDVPSIEATTLEIGSKESMEHVLATDCKGWSSEKLFVNEFVCRGGTYPCR